MIRTTLHPIQQAMRINRQSHYHTQEIVIKQNSSDLTRRLIQLPKEEFDLITGIGIIVTLNNRNVNFKLGYTSNSKEFINLVHHRFFSVSDQVAPKDRLMPVLFEYRLDDRVDCRILLPSTPITEDIRFDLIVRVENAQFYNANRSQPSLPNNRL